jgi:hypothetical protein
MYDISANKLVAIDGYLGFRYKKTYEVFGKCLEMTDHK